MALLHRYRSSALNDHSNVTGSPLDTITITNQAPSGPVVCGCCRRPSAIIQPQVRFPSCSPAMLKPDSR